MKTQKLQILDDEIIISISGQKDTFWGTIITITIIVGISALAGIIEAYFGGIVKSGFVLMLGIVVGSFVSIRWFHLKNPKKPAIIITRKYIIIQRDISYLSR